jgi:hypothetical protein
MSGCRENRKDLLSYAAGEMDEPRRTIMTEHLDQCSDCRKEVEDLRAILEGAGSIKEEIRRALETVDWSALPARITDAVFAQAGRPKRETTGRERFRLWLHGPHFKPVLAGVLMGVVIGALAMVLVLRRTSTGPVPGSEFFASSEFLDRVELEMARRETLNYLRKSEYVLLDFVQASPTASLSSTAFGTEQARDLLSRKKYLNAQLEKYQMAKAKAICDQIELLFLELAQISEELPRAELENIQNIIRERQLLLKINLVTKELEHSEV